MCDGRIQRNQRFPKNPTNGQVPAWNSATKNWEAVNQSGGAELPAGTNADDILLWDNIGNEYYSSPSPFTSRSNPEIIGGEWLFNNTITLSGGTVDPFGVASPLSGFTTGADIDGNLFYKNSLGGIITFRTASIATDPIFDLPSETGTIALRGKTGIHFDSDANISASLQVLKDPANNNLPISVSTGQVFIAGSLTVDSDIKINNNLGYGIKSANDQRVLNVFNGLVTSLGTNWAFGHTSASARIHVRGDGTNPVSRFESSSGVSTHVFTETGLIQFGQFGSFVNIYPAAANDLNTPTIAGSAMVFRTNVGSSSANSYSYFFRPTNGAGTIQSISGTNGFMNLTGSGFSAAAGSGNYRHLDIGYTINNSGAQTGTATGIFLNATETALNGMAHNLLTLQTGGTNRLTVSNGGWGRFGSFVGIANENVTLASYGNGQMTFLDNTFANFNRLNIGGNSNLFPSIKRNGAGIDFRVADDTAYADVATRTITAAAGIVYLNTSANVFIITGTGSPEGVQAARIGSIYLRTDGDVMSTLYIKTTGTGNTGWTAK